MPERAESTAERTGRIIGEITKRNLEVLPDAQQTEVLLGQLLVNVEPGHLDTETRAVLEKIAAADRVKAEDFDGAALRHVRTEVNAQILAMPESVRLPFLRRELGFAVDRIGGVDDVAHGMVLRVLETPSDEEASAVTRPMRVVNADLVDDGQQDQPSQHVWRDPSEAETVPILVQPHYPTQSDPEVTVHPSEAVTEPIPIPNYSPNPGAGASVSGQAPEAATAESPDSVVTAPIPRLPSADDGEQQPGQP